MSEPPPGVRKNSNWGPFITQTDLVEWRGGWKTWGSLPEESSGFGGDQWLLPEYHFVLPGTKGAPFQAWGREWPLTPGKSRRSYLSGAVGIAKGGQAGVAGDLDSTQAVSDQADG